MTGVDDRGKYWLTNTATMRMMMMMMTGLIPLEVYGCWDAARLQTDGAFITAAKEQRAGGTQAPPGPLELFDRRI